MEIPFDYILISIMINLKNRKVKAEVSKQSLIKIINKIFFTENKKWYCNINKLMIY